MASYKSETISKLMDGIKNKTLLLPSIQRNFVWKEEKITALFDSIMQDYPIGTFLFWSIKGKQVNEYVFNTFLDEYNEKNDIQRGSRISGVEESASFIGVLDGQQRITALYLGAYGTFKLHKKGTSWSSDDSFIPHYLCIDILHFPGQEDDSYSFALKEIPDKDGLGVKESVKTESGDLENHFWVKVSDVVVAQFDAADLVEKIESRYFDGTLHQELRSKARKILNTLNVNFTSIENVNYYEVTQTDLSEVVEIFVRVNSGGQTLTASDLILSIASGQDDTIDFQRKIQDAVDTISSAPRFSESAFEADKDLVLTAGLMFTGANSLALRKKENTSSERINTILGSWDNIVESICNASKYIEDIGFDGKHLTSKNLILPIAYYFYKNNIESDHAKKRNARAKKDKVYIRQWLLRAMINSIFRDGIGSTLLSIRNIIDSSSGSCFPLDKLMNAESKRSLKITDDTIQEILEYKYGDGRVLPLLMEITGSDAPVRYNVDHLWAKSILNSAIKLKKYLPTEGEVVKAEYKKRCNYLPNLALLEQNPNIDKGDKLYDEWMRAAHPSPTNDPYFSMNVIPTDSGLYEFSKFIMFYDTRKTMLETKLRDIFPETFEDINTKHGLTRRRTRS